MKRSDIPEIEVLRTVRDFHANLSASPEQSLSYPPKVVMARMEQLVGRGLLDYGVSLRTAFLTEAGKQRLSELEAEEARAKNATANT